VKKGLSCIPYYSLAAGFLTGKYRSEKDLGKSPRGQGVQKYLDAKGKRILAALDKVAESTGAAHAEIALAWINAQPGIAAPIASATSVRQLQSLARGARLALSAEDEKLLTDAGLPGA
jgi:aryl-alcohol dehydrogenase-like predicted oxidoreductase